MTTQTEAQTKAIQIWQIICDHKLTGIKQGQVKAQYEYKHGQKLAREFDAMLESAGFCAFRDGENRLYPSHDMNTGTWWEYTDDLRFIGVSRD